MLHTMLPKAYDPKTTEDPTPPGEPLPKTYDPARVEDRIYRMWEKSGAFRADRESGKEPFTISMPPPNATGRLHLGHAVTMALEDIFIRFNRMRGKEALWLPGTDHAAIATESVVIRMLQKDERIADPRKVLGREKLIARIREFVEESRGTIRDQVRKMGASCDWERERYTMDPALARSTYEIFADMYRRGVIYRGHRIVNWDPKLQTTLADDEVVWDERVEPFYTFQYGPFQISTSRPETKFGDKYVVMHPEDERYKKFKHGEQFGCEWINGVIKATIIKDAEIDMKFGTGVMTITPWHDFADFDIAERHKLDKEQIIDESGYLLPIAGEFEGMHILDGRPKIVEKLEKKGLLVKTDGKYVHNVAVSSRGGGLVEPQIKEQWFVDVRKQVIPWKGKTLSIKEVMQDTVRSGMIRIIPDRFEKTYFQWIDNLRDWCISRQIWWGHRIPAWYKGSHIHVGAEPPEGSGWEQDPDTLDTWFGVSQWTWSTLMDPKLAEDRSLSLKQIIEQSPDFKRFHPTDILETGYDILFFWVARMILMTTYSLSMLGIGKSELDRIPFKTVYLHGLIRTRDGKKMSKSDPSTMIDPLDIIPKYGADALRLSMIIGQGPGADSRLYEEKIAGFRNFVNKLWNASRFVLMQCDKIKVDPHAKTHLRRDGIDDLNAADRWILSRTQRLIQEVTEGLEADRLSEAGQRLYDFVWSEYCDWYLELSKEQPNTRVLLEVLQTVLILLHPYIPFVTEEIWSKVGGPVPLIKASWPEPVAAWIHDEAEVAAQTLIDVVSALRKIRADYGIEAGKEISAIIHTGYWVEFLESQERHIRRLAHVKSLTFDTDPKVHKNSASIFLSGVEVHVPLEGVIDLAKERTRLSKEQTDMKKYVQSLEKKLSDKKFVENAPEDIVTGEKAKLESFQEKLKNIEDKLASLR